MSSTLLIKKRMSATIEHPNLGSYFFNKNLVSIQTDPISDTEEVSEPGIGGNRMIGIVEDGAKKITIEVQTASLDEAFLRRIQNFPEVEFSVQWIDARNAAATVGGTGTKCILKRPGNNRTDDTQTFEIYAGEYTGD